jgi:type IV secretory pathway VirB9-like protein
VRSLILSTCLLCSVASVPARGQSPGSTGGVREVSATGRTVIPIAARIRFTTMVLLPDDEEILDVVCGDRDFWVIAAARNMAHIKPAKEGGRTNLNLVTTSGRVYSFLLTESKSGSPDLKVYVAPDDALPKERPRFFTAAEMDALNQQLVAARAAAEAERQASTATVASFKENYPAQLRFEYQTAKYEPPFHVRAIWHDGLRTYMRADTRQLPTLYEIVDGKPTLVTFHVKDGMYVVHKVLDRGYLALGKKRWTFERRAS